MDYDLNNREERYACSHLFRLLHEPKNQYRALSEFLNRPVEGHAFRIYAEVALIRDAYYARKSNIGPFMDQLVRLIMAQKKSVSNCRVYTELPEELSNPAKTHPKQILHKAEKILNSDEKEVYKAVQAVFNAKPDLAICIEEDLFVYEAKLTLNFTKGQIKHTENIAELWRNLLFADLGFSAPPKQRSVLKLGLSKFTPDICWKKIADIAEKTYPEHDRTRLFLVHLGQLDDPVCNKQF